MKNRAGQRPSAVAISQWLRRHRRLVPSPIVRAAKRYLTGWVETWRAPCRVVGQPEWAFWQIEDDAADQGRSFISTAPPPMLGKALGVEVLDADVRAAQADQSGSVPEGWRSEVTAPFEEYQGNVTRYRWWTYLDPHHDTDPVGVDGRPVWQVIARWHQRNDRGDVAGDPPLALIIERDAILLHLNAPKQDADGVWRGARSVAGWIAEATRGKWHHFSLEIFWTTGAGYVSVAHDGRHVLTFSSHPTLYWRGHARTPGEVRLRMGICRRAIRTVGNGVFRLYHYEVTREIRRECHLGPAPYTLMDRTTAPGERPMELAGRDSRAIPNLALPRGMTSEYRGNVPQAGGPEPRADFAGDIPT